MGALLGTPASSTVLFRVNSKAQVQQYLAAAGINAVPQPGKSLNVQGRLLVVDTMNRQSWNKSPSGIHVAVVYPVDALDADGGSECVEDLRRRGAKKILLVTWTDNKDFAWVEHYSPVRVTYDAEAERPEYHEHMQEIEAQTAHKEVPRNLPQYAQTTPPELLVRIECWKCRGSTWARLNKPYPSIEAIRNAQAGEFKATCLKCGMEADDNYNWYER